MWRELNPCGDVSVERVQLERRYGDALRSVSAEEICVVLRPTSPDLPVPVSSITCACLLPQGYPSFPARLSLRPDRGSSLPDIVVAEMNAIVQARIAQVDFGARPMLRQALRWLEQSGVAEALCEVIRAQEESLRSQRPAFEDAPASAPAPAPEPEPEPTPTLMFAPAPIPTPAIGHSSKSPDSGTTPKAARSPVSTHAALPARAASPSRGAQSSATYIAAFASQATWTHEEQAAFERALHEVVDARRRSPGDARTWTEVAARVNGGCAGGERRTADECAARFLALRRLCELWLQACLPAPAEAERVPTLPASRASMRVEEAGAESEGQGAAESVSAPACSLEDDVDDNAFDMFGRARVGAGAGAEESSEDEWESSDADEDEVVGQGGGAPVEGEEVGEEKDEEEEHGVIDDSEHSPLLLNICLRPSRTGFELLFERPSLSGIGTLAASRVHFLCKCDRCGAVSSASLGGAVFRARGACAAGDPAAASAAAAAAAAASEVRRWCSCSLLLSLAFRPTLVHDGCATLGFVDATHCRVLTLLDCSLLASCLECGEPGEVAKFAAPATTESSCHVCYSRMRLDARGSSVRLASSGGGDGIAEAAADAAVAAKLKATGRRPQFVAGRALPDRGACRHYKHSWRWLRFPCCDEAFPCDVCHDTASDHPHIWAKRQICGSCSREQSFSNEPCITCGAAVRRGGASGLHRFWEGGVGERNRALLSRNDPRKHALSRLKTVSMKATRVGDPKDRRAATLAPRTFERYHWTNAEVVETVVVKQKRPRK